MAGMAVFITLMIAQKQMLYGAYQETLAAEEKIRNIYKLTLGKFITIRADDGIDIRAFWMPHPNQELVPNIPTVLFLHVQANTST